MSDVVLREAIKVYVERMHHMLDGLHNAIENGDVDAQHSSLAGLVGLLEMLKSAADNEDHT